LFNIITTPDIMPILSAGGHHNPAEGACVMEYQSLLAGEPFSDTPICVDEQLTSFMQSINDTMPDEHRYRLAPFLGRAIGLVAPGRPREGDIWFKWAFDSRPVRAKGLRRSVNACWGCSYVKLCERHQDRITQAVAKAGFIRGVDLLNEQLHHARAVYNTEALKLRTIVLGKLEQVFSVEATRTGSGLPIDAMNFSTWYRSQLEIWAEERGFADDPMDDEVVDRCIEMTEALHVAYEQAMVDLGWEVKRELKCELPEVVDQVAQEFNCTL
jgi:hypothetical protein